ncbi:hypothetical protein [Streptomyces sp. NPDC090029]|uniref:hypothetical protein n=1 Tax=unclassified Streptomyces TaxID=2593676 RepID=UPI00380CA930
MAHPPYGGTAHQAAAPVHPGPEHMLEPVPAYAPAQRGPAGGGGALAGVRRRMSGAATTEPGRLRITGALLAVLLVVFGATAAVAVSERAAAADDVVGRSQPLSRDAASVYRSLADANTTASTGFLAGAEESPAVRERYAQDISRASRLLVTAATHTDASSESGRQIAHLNEYLPRYTGLIESARANNRLGRPLGGAYLRYADALMTEDLLPAARRLHLAESARLEADHEAARSWPLVAPAAGVVALAVLGWAQRRNYRLTNRVFNRGLLGATVAAALVLLWVVGAQALASSRLHDADVHAQRSLDVLNDARIDALRARANENLTLVARGAVLTDDGKDDKYAAEYAQTMDTLGAALERALHHADDEEGRRPVDTAVRAMGEWRTRHDGAAGADREGDYEGAVRKVIGREGSTNECFDTVDAALAEALAHEQREFTAAAVAGRSALDGLAAGAALLTLAGAVAAILGVNRRLAEYR